MSLLVSRKGNSSISYSLHSAVAFKVIIIGSLGVGKTSLINRFVKDVFDKNYRVTVGMEFYSKVLNIFG